jgi:hypothetical protein
MPLMNWKKIMHSRNWNFPFFPYFPYLPSKMEKNYNEQLPRILGIKDQL